MFFGGFFGLDIIRFLLDMDPFRSVRRTHVCSSDAFRVDSDDGDIEHTLVSLWAVCHCGLWHSQQAISIKYYKVALGEAVCSGLQSILILHKDKDQTGLIAEQANVVTIPVAHTIISFNSTIVYRQCVSLSSWYCAHLWSMIYFSGMVAKNAV